MDTITLKGKFMINLTNTALSSNLYTPSSSKMQETNKLAKKENNAVSQDDFSWKYGTPWENTSDEELAKINARLNNSFKVLKETYYDTIKDIEVVENSIAQQLVEGRIDKKELDNFINKNPLSFIKPIDKEVESVYKQSVSLDEFKAKWLELKNTRSIDLTKMLLKFGFKSDLELSNFDYTSIKFQGKVDIKA